MWVADTSMRSVGRPVSFDACSFAASINARSIMHVSTTQKATRVTPSSSTSAFANNGSTTLSAVRSVNMPLTRTGNAGGAMSTASAPARKGAWVDGSAAATVTAVAAADPVARSPARNAHPAAANTTKGKMRVTIIIVFTG